MSRSPYPERLDLMDFIAVFGSVYEHSPWVAEAVYPSLTPGIDVAPMAKQMRSVVDTASDELKLDLLPKESWDFPVEGNHLHLINLQKFL